jgi:hypothetical protein
MVMPINTEGELKIINNPYLKEVLAQQRIILELQRKLIEVMMAPMMIYTGKGGKR